MHRRIVAAVIGCVAISALACGGDETPAAMPTAESSVGGPISIADGQSLVIGVSVPLDSSQRAGQDLANAVELAITDFGRPIRGRTVTARAIDDGCNDAELASDAAKQFTADEQVAGVIGPMCTTGAEAANDVYEAAGMVHIAASATRDDLSAVGEQYFFRTAWNDSAQAGVQANYARVALGAETAVVIDDNDPYGKNLAEAFVPAFEAAGGRVLAHEHIARGVTDLAVFARQVVAAEADVIVYEGLDPEGGLIARALQAVGSEAVFIGPDSLLNARDFIGSDDGALQGVVITGGLAPDEAFAARFVERFGHAPSTSFVLQAYDAARILLTAIETVAEEDGAGPVTIDRAALAAAMRGQSFAGLTGTSRFDERGDRSGSTPRELGLAIYRVSGEAFEIIE